ncbi:glycosyltransferase family 9 protein [Tamlana sp. 2_MG-2023]|uniref:glycosyltransferase family 9 protein n=1 Tax=unclassified Tamlana TaxID=2614803 RepID=UPI0026E4687F|nr:MULTISPECIES: glycosyltransferase family 9 protein [unclassified Tamlana]MDO6759767.1 glycosyltransferase family 9 protein [Tamlana sp. 2_MG-2023]MDO6791390.1 glycosyltransferase family 9 protein [Tamlana sp. 1_MG-2023]
MPNSKHILVIRLSAMGDVAMSVPVVRALIEQYPEVKITILTRGFFKPFFRGIPRVTVFSAEVKGDHKGVFGLYKLAQALNKNNFYAVADLHHVLRSKILKLFLSSKRFIALDKGREGKRALISGEKFEPLKTTHQRYVDVFEKLGFPIDLSNPTFPERVVLNEGLLELLGRDSKKWIGIAPFAAHQGKVYPLDLMKQVVEKLTADYNVILFGGKEDREALSAFENTVNLAGKLSFDEELDIISNLDIMLSMDSGNAHLAAMLGVKVITIWGVTHPFAGFAPFNQPKDHALCADRAQFPKVPTSVYGNKYPEGYEKAAGSIAPEVVLAKINKVLASDKS